MAGRENRKRSARYYALWGAITDVALGPAVTAHLLSDGAFFAFGGAVGGGAYWWIKGNHGIAETSDRLS